MYAGAVETVQFSDVMFPDFDFITFGSREKVSIKEIIEHSEKGIEFKIEFDNYLKSDFSDLPLAFNNVLDKFKFKSVDVSSSIFESFSQLKNLNKFNFEKTDKKLFDDRLKNKISLQEYKLAKIYLGKLKEYLELVGVILNILGKILSDYQKDPSKMLSGEKSLGLKSKLDDYMIRYLTFLSLMYVLQERKMIFDDSVFNKVNLYAMDLSNSHKQVLKEIKEAF